MREQVETINQEVTKLRAEVKKHQQEKFQNKEQEANREMDSQAKVEKLKNDLSLCQMRLEDQEKENERLKVEKSNLRKLQKETEDKVTKYATQYMPKIKATQDFQKEIWEKVQQIKNDSELLPWMFRAEAKESKKYKVEKEKAVTTMRDYEKDHFKLVNQRDDMENEIKRKERMAMIATAARSQMKN